MIHFRRYQFLLLFLLVFFNFFGFSQDTRFALTNAKIYIDPYTPPIENGTIIINGNRIEKVGSGLSIPANTRKISLTGKTILAGFWNNHIHLMEPQWLATDSLSDMQLSRQFDSLLTSYGFTHAVDMAALEAGNLTRLRKRLEAGNVTGPSLLFAGVPFAPPKASPFYIAPYKIPELSTIQEVEQHIKTQFGYGADVIKIWSASPTGKEVIKMPDELIQTAASITRQHKKVLAAHPTNLEGAEQAVNNGVNLLVHTAPDDRKPLPESLLKKMIEKKVALIPTLQLNKWDLEINGIPAENNPLLLTAVGQLEQFHQSGGTVLFGTDLGYMTNYNPRDEWMLMQKAGLSYLEILATMTTNPAQFFGKGKDYGRVATGYLADLVVLEEDPATSIEALSNVFCVFKHGKQIYQKR